MPKKKLQKQNEKLLKLLEWLKHILDHVDNLEGAEEWDQRIQALEREIINLKPKVCWRLRVEEILFSEEVKQ